MLHTLSVFSLSSKFVSASEHLSLLIPGLDSSPRCTYSTHCSPSHTSAGRQAARGGTLDTCWAFWQTAWHYRQLAYKAHTLSPAFPRR